MRSLEAIFAMVTAATAFALVVVLQVRRSRSPQRTEGLFRCRLRKVAGNGSGSYVWPRRQVRARWVHDVLVVYRGRLDRGADLFPVSSVHGRVGPVVDVHGDPCISLRLELDDGSTVDLAARPHFAEELAGPFLGAHSKLHQARGQ
jgi:hypothetical protein